MVSNEMDYIGGVVGERREVGEGAYKLHPGHTKYLEKISAKT